MNLHTLKILFLPPRSNVSFTEKALSGLASLDGISLVMLVSSLFLDTKELPWVVASMGASAVLLFAERIADIGTDEQAKRSLRE